MSENDRKSPKKEHNQKIVKAYSQRHASSLVDNGLPIHEVVACDTQIGFVGLCFDGNAHDIRVSWRRLWRLKLGIAEVLRLGKLTSKQLACIVGHITWTLLLKRECLSILNSVYAFMNLHSDIALGLWPSVRRELRQVASILPLICCKLGLPWSDDVYVRDSSSEGYAVLKRTLPHDIICNWGRTSERWRFDCTAAIQARAHALGDPTCVDPCDPSQLIDGSRTVIPHSSSEIDKRVS